MGDGAAWTSPDGQAWTLAPGTGIAPLQAADRVLALAGIGRGFLAVGENVPGGDQAKATPVAWTSADGLNWRRLPATSLHLAVPARGRVLRLTQVAAHGSDVIVEGETATAHGQGKHRVTSLSDAVWRSRNGGRSWAAAHLPAGHGAAGQIAGVAVAGHRFVAIRPGRTRRTGSDALAYVSRGGASWTRAATITAAKKDHLKITAVGGSDQGAVVSGQLAGGARVAWVSTDGRAWRRVAGLGSSAQTLAGVTVTAGQDRGRGRGHRARRRRPAAVPGPGRPSGQRRQLRRHRRGSRPGAPGQRHRGRPAAPGWPSAARTGTPPSGRPPARAAGGGSAPPP